MNSAPNFTPLTHAVLAIGLATAAGLCAADQYEADDHSHSGAATWCADRCDAVITDWSLTAFRVIKGDDGYQNPLTATRSLAMMHLAMHDAANAARPRYQRYALAAQPASATKADAAVAAAAAAHAVLAALYPQPQVAALLEAELEKTLIEAGVSPDIAAGREFGRAAAAAVLAKRSNDGSAGNETYVEGTQPGQYRFTPPFDFVLAPHWRRVTPFALASASQFRTTPAPALTSDAYRRDFDEVKRVGGKDAGAQRSSDETHYAAFWYEFADIGWNRIARASSSRVKQDLWDRARTFALLNAAMADAYIAGWDSKFQHNFWRPVTAIHLAGNDGNPNTVAATTVLAQAFGRDRVAFSFASSSASPANPVRSYRSFSEAARENADSRVKAGLHFRFATTAGLEMGRQIGQYVSRNALPRQHGAAPPGE